MTATRKIRCGTGLERFLPAGCVIELVDGGTTENRRSVMNNTPRQFPPPSGRCRLCGFTKWTGGAETGDWKCGCCGTRKFTAPPVRRQRRPRTWNGR